MNNNIDNKIFAISIIGNCTRQFARLDCIKEKPTKNLSDLACYEPDLFWRSKCARQGGGYLNARCIIKNSSIK